MNRIVVAIAAGLALVAAVGIFLLSQVPSDEVGMGIPTENLVDRPVAAAVPISGEAKVGPKGCLLLDIDGTSYFVVWPAGYRYDANAAIAPDGTRMGGGHAIAGEGWIRQVDDVVAAADGPDGYMDMATGFCTDGEMPVAVLKSITS
jgi:hypothetical protein